MGVLLMAAGSLAAIYGTELILALVLLTFGIVLVIYALWEYKDESHSREDLLNTAGVFIEKKLFERAIKKCMDFTEKYPANSLIYNAAQRIQAEAIIEESKYGVNEEASLKEAEILLRYSLKMVDSKWRILDRGVYKSETAKCNKALGTVLFRLGEIRGVGYFKEGEALLGEAEKYFRGKEPLTHSKVLNNLGLTKLYLRGPVEAMSYYDEAVETIRNSKNEIAEKKYNTQMAYVLNNIANAYILQIKTKPAMRGELILTALKKGKEALSFLTLQGEEPELYSRIVLSMNSYIMMLAHEPNLNRTQLLDDAGAMLGTLKELLTADRFPRSYHSLQLQLGIHYMGLAGLMQNEGANKEKIIEALADGKRAFNEASRFYTLVDYPKEYRVIKNNLSGLSKMAEFLNGP